jgi:NAD(P)-dependent dehydrogenase (short-subunit alcohol dehydrogenase family)
MRSLRGAFLQHLPFSCKSRRGRMLWPPRVAVVTGANRGLGLSLAECLAESGTHVVLAARDEQLCTAAATALASAKGVSVEAVQLDVQCGRSIEVFGAYCERTFGGVDLLVNNAAVCEAGWSEAVVRRALRTNVLGPRALTRRLLPALRQQPHGQVLHVSSGDGELLYLNPELQRQMAAVDSERTLLCGKAEPPASWLSGSSFQRQIVLQAAPSFGQPRSLSRLARINAGRPYRSCFPPGRHTAAAAGGRTPTVQRLRRCARVRRLAGVRALEGRAQRPDARAGGRRSGCVGGCRMPRRRPHA